MEGPNQEHLNIFGLKGGAVKCYNEFKWTKKQAACAMIWQQMFLDE